MKPTSRKLPWLAALSVLVGAGAVTLMSWPGRRPERSVAPARAPSAVASDPIAMAASAPASPGGSMIERLPVAPYGSDPKPFIRQRHDYPPNTPERLGPKVGRVLFDLETVTDEVSRADQATGRIAEVRGDPVEPEDRERARKALQKFFDEATPIVDQALVGVISSDQAFEKLLEKRTALNCDLMVSLGLYEEQLFFLWPQTKDVLGPSCRNPRPTEPFIVPEGQQLRGEHTPGKHPVSE